MRARAALLFLVVATPAPAQDFIFGVHGGSTGARSVVDGASGANERGASMGLTGSIAMKPWLALQVELLWTDKGSLGPGSGPHRYFEAPYMLRLASPRTLRGLRPFGLLGAAHAWELTCVADCASADHPTTDFSYISGLGVSTQIRRLELAVEHRLARGQHNQSSQLAQRSTRDVRSLVFRLSVVIPGVVPDWM